MVLRLLFLAAALLLLTPVHPAQADMAVFSSEHGLAIRGYDTVAYFEQGRAVPGSGAHEVMWKGVVWRFTSARNQASFEANPRAYAPRFGGYCAYAMSNGILASGNPDLWVINGGRLYLLNNAAVLEIWQGQTDERIAAARGNWPGVLRK